MKINLSEAVKQFYSNPSLDLVYFEAIANSLDARATNIDVTIKIKSFEEADTLQIMVKDNGVGFDKRGYDRFCKLLESDFSTNKGMGRLIFVNYFKKVIYKTYSKDFQRKFELNESFEGQSEPINELENFGTHLNLSGYKLQRINTYDYIKAESLKQSIEMHFLPRLFLLKKSNIDTKISIKVETQKDNVKQKFFSDTQVITTSSLPVFKEDKFNIPLLDLFHEFHLHYLVEKNYETADFKIAITTDTRTIDISNIISKDNIPQNYNCIFLVNSDFFEGKSNNSRQKLDIDDVNFKILKQTIIQQIKAKLEEEIPDLIEKNRQQKNYLDKKFPHLVGYFEDDVIGLIDKNKVIEKAQTNFFKDQKRILEVESMDDNQYKKSLEISSRVLAEYILYRNLIIQKLKHTNKNNSEEEIHNLIIPMRETFRGNEKFNHLYRNNAWLLDDKFMTYSTILSDQSLQKLINEIKIEEELALDKNTEPDISIVFNGNPEEECVDVVVIEIKKRYDKLHENEKAINQIQRRARRLLEYYPTNIQRLWFYAIVDIDKELGLSLKSDGYKEIFSTGKTFFKSQSIYYEDKKRNEQSCPVDITVLSYDAMLNDAQARNDTFLDILKETIRKQSLK